MITIIVTQDSECDLIMPSPYFNDETLTSTLKTKSQNFSIYSLKCRCLNAKIYGYQLISQGRTCTAHGGLAIFLNNDFNFIHSRSYVKSTIWEAQFIEISMDRRGRRTLVPGNVYMPPRDLNENYQTLIDELTPVLYDLQKKAMWSSHSRGL